MKFRDQEEYKNILETTPEYFIKLYEICPDSSFTVVKDNNIVCLTGFVPSFLSYCDMYFFAAENLEKLFAKDVYMAFKYILNYTKTAFPRIQTTCKENARNKRFLEFLGFQQECLMKKYGFRKEDMYLYSLITE
jgi:hypothetical protein